jgi:hypothetical protein
MSATDETRPRFFSIKPNLMGGRFFFYFGPCLNTYGTAWCGRAWTWKTTRKGPTHE